MESGDKKTRMKVIGLNLGRLKSGFEILSTSQDLPS